MPWGFTAYGGILAVHLLLLGAATYEMALSAKVPCPAFSAKRSLHVTI